MVSDADGMKPWLEGKYPKRKASWYAVRQGLEDKHSLAQSKWFRLKDISDFKIIVFTRTLRDFIREGCDEYGVPTQTVVTSTQFFRELLEEYGVDYEASDNFEADRVLLCGKAQSLIEEKGISNTIEALLVDECQDYLDTELHIFRKLATRLILAADSRQSIYKPTQTPGS